MTYLLAEMQCCDDIELESEGGVRECHPYLLGKYRKIGECGGRSFYQHVNNTDIFLYHACGAWYTGLQVGVCGGWMVAKSLEICVTSTGHQTEWQYYDEGELNTDKTFNVKEECKFYQDFHSLPTTVRVSWLYILVPWSPL